MKFFILMVLSLAPLNSHAKKGEPETEAIYIVPSSPELVSHSRFVIQIIDAFTGPETEKISYIFPEILIGEKNRLVEFSRIEGTENSWRSDLLTAHCTTIEDTFSCNLQINREPPQSLLEKISNYVLASAHAAVGRLCQGQALANLETMGLNDLDINSFTSVILNFCSGEPAGIMSYEYR